MISEKNKIQNDLKTNSKLAYLKKNFFDVEIFLNRMMTVDFRSVKNEMIRKYNIESPEEIMLIDLMISSYTRALHLERLVDELLFQEEKTFHINEDKAKNVNHLYKAAEKAHNQYIRAYNSFKRSRQPAPTININTKNAVFGDQEINNNG